MALKAEQELRDWKGIWQFEDLIYAGDVWAKNQESLLAMFDSIFAKNQLQIYSKLDVIEI